MFHDLFSIRVTDITKEIHIFSRFNSTKNCNLIKYKNTEYIIININIKYHSEFSFSNIKV